MTAGCGDLWGLGEDDGDCMVLIDYYWYQRDCDGSQQAERAFLAPKCESNLFSILILYYLVQNLYHLQEPQLSEQQLDLKLPLQLQQNLRFNPQHVQKQLAVGSLHQHKLEKCQKGLCKVPNNIMHTK